MTNFFYHHLLLLDEVIACLDSHDLDPEERAELISLIHQTIHHQILNVILNHLPREHHDNFLSLLQESPTDPKILDFLKHQIKIDIEEAISTHATRIKKEILSEIKKSRQRT